MLNRLMFVYFIQRKGFLDGDRDYLRNRLNRMFQEHGKDKFYSFYRYFLLRLFHEGLGSKNRSAELETLVGRIPYLNGGLFDVHELEKSDRYGSDIQIPDEAFERVFDYFDQYQWHLDERPLRADNEINPDVLGYIFEKYINQKQMGAYYTKEDITEYISKNTVLPFLFDDARPKCEVAFENPKGPTVWNLLRDDPDRYIYSAVRHGADLPLPEEISVGLNPPTLHEPVGEGPVKTLDLRKDWNKPASTEFGLPTETWREVVARRTRYEEIKAKLAGGEVREIDELITLNLDIRQFTQDVIENCEGPELLRALWNAIEKISVLDPTCGSGAFLFAALNILESLYEVCLDRMEAFVEDAELSGEKQRPGKYAFALMETPAVGAEVEPETRAAGQVPSPGTAVRPQGMAARPRATSRKDTRQAAAPPPSRSTAIAAATAVGTTQASVSSSPGAVKRIELPHWKKYIPEDLDANLERAPGLDQTSNGSNGQAHRPGASEPSAPEKFSSAPAVADEPTLAAAASSPGPAAAVQLALTPDRPDPASSATRLDSYAEPAAPIPVAARLRSPSLAVLHDEILDIRRLLHRFLEDQPLPRLPPASQIGLLAGNSFLANQYDRLAQKGLDPMLIFRLISPLFPLAQMDRNEDLENEHESRLRAALESLCDTTAELGDQNAPARVCAFVGPSGAGKTSCVAKLAIQQGWQQGLRIHLISLDHAISGLLSSYRPTPESRKFRLLLWRTYPSWVESWTDCTLKGILTVPKSCRPILFFPILPFVIMWFPILSFPILSFPILSLLIRRVTHRWSRRGRLRQPRPLRRDQVSTGTWF